MQIYNRLLIFASIYLKKMTNHLKFFSVRAKEALQEQQGERLKKIRKELNLSQKAFSDKLGVDQSYISQIERGKKTIHGNMLLSMITDLKITVNMNWFFYGIGDMLLPEKIPMAEEPRAAYHIRAREQIEQVQGTMQILIKQLDDIKGGQ